MMHCMSPCGIALLYQLYYCFILIYWLLSFSLVCVLPPHFFSWRCSPIAVGNSFFDITFWELILIFIQYLFLFPGASGVINFPCLLCRCLVIFFQWNLIKNDTFTYRYGIKLGEYLDILHSKLGRCLNTQKAGSLGYTEPEQYLVSGIGRDRKKLCLKKRCQSTVWMRWQCWVLWQQQQPPIAESACPLLSILPPPWVYAEKSTHICTPHW